MTLLSDYEVCKEGDVLTPEQARVLVRSPRPPATHPVSAAATGGPTGTSDHTHPPDRWFPPSLTEAFRV